MTIAVLKEIIDTEEQANQIEAQAQQKAREVIASAKKEATAMIEKAVGQAELDARGIIKNSTAKAAGDINAMNEKIRAQCQEIKDNSSRKLGDAVDFIVGRIVKQSDC